PRRVRHDHGRHEPVPGVRRAPARPAWPGRDRGTIGPAGRVTASRSRLEESPTPKGRTLGKPQAAKADGKWHRKETASSDSPETLKVRVKRWGKSPPAPW